VLSTDDRPASRISLMQVTLLKLVHVDDEWLGPFGSLNYIVDWRNGSYDPIWSSITPLPLRRLLRIATRVIIPHLVTSLVRILFHPRVVSNFAALSGGTQLFSRYTMVTSALWASFEKFRHVG